MKETLKVLGFRYDGTSRTWGKHAGSLTEHERAEIATAARNVGDTLNVQVIRDPPTQHVPASAAATPSSPLGPHQLSPSSPPPPAAAAAPQPVLPVLLPFSAANLEAIAAGAEAVAEAAAQKARELRRASLAGAVATESGASAELAVEGAEGAANAAKAYAVEKRLQATAAREGRSSLAVDAGSGGGGLLQQLSPHALRDAPATVTRTRQPRARARSPLPDQARWDSIARPFHRAA